MSNWKKALDRSLNWVDDNTRDGNTGSSGSPANTTTSSSSAAKSTAATSPAPSGASCAEALDKAKCALDTAKAAQETAATIAALRKANIELERRLGCGPVAPAAVLELVPATPRKMATGLVFGFCLAAAVGAGVVLGMEGMRNVMNRRNK